MRSGHPATDMSGSWVTEPNTATIDNAYYPSTGQSPDQDYVTKDLPSTTNGDGTVHQTEVTIEGVSYSSVTIWGSGIVSFGPPTAAEISAYQANSVQPNGSGFPGSFIAFGAQSPSADTIFAAYSAQDASLNIAFTSADGLHSQNPPGSPETSAMNIAFSTTGITIYSAANYNLHGDVGSTPATSNGDTILYSSFEDPACYVEGTSILTNRGEIAIETLQVGDTVITSSGREAFIRWVGHREIECRRHGHPERVFPIEVASNAIADGVPNRPLLVSPHHAIAINHGGEVIVPAMRLVNGSTIQVKHVDRVRYWHLELDNHDLVIANGTAAETYQDIGNRSEFENGGESLTLHPIFLNGTQADCRPRIVDGERLSAIRERLEARAVLLGWKKTIVENKIYVKNEFGLLPHSVKPDGIEFSVRRADNAIIVHSDTFEPRCAGFDAIDARPLGCYVSGIDIVHSSGEIEQVAMDDPRLSKGFHDIETNHAGVFRWTNGAAELPCTLWSAITGEAVCIVRLSVHAVQKWSVAELGSQENFYAAA